MLVGGEYISHEFNDFCEECEILCQPTTTYILQ